MKTIVYIFITLIIGSILISAIPMPPQKNGELITLQCSDLNADISLLNNSADILKSRLSDFSSEKFEIKVVQEKKQIQIQLSKKMALKDLESLLVQKGSIGFYETYNQESLSALLKGDKQLFSLLNDVVNNSSAEIGCTSSSDLNKVIEYLSSVGLSQKCKFAWGQFSKNGDACLYALKLNENKGAILTGSDIKSMTYNQEKDLKNYSLEILFKDSGIKIWSMATEKNINHAIAILVDNSVMSAPILKSKIDNGKCSITGNFSKEQVQYLAAIGNNGELSLHFEIVK